MIGKPIRHANLKFARGKKSGGTGGVGEKGTQFTFGRKSGVPVGEAL